MSDQPGSFPPPPPSGMPSMPSMPTPPPMPSMPSMPSPPPMPGMPLPEGMGNQGFGQPYGGPPMGGFPGGAAGAIPLADSGLRMAARALDVIIRGIITCIPNFALIGGATALASRNSAEPISFAATAGSAVLTAIIVLLYDGVVTGLLGGTLMKKAFGMKVVNQSDGMQVNMQTALLRAAPSAALALLGLIPILGGLAGFIVGVASLIMLFTDKMRQTVADKVAKTVVIKAK